MHQELNISILIEIAISVTHFTDAHRYLLICFILGMCGQVFSQTPVSSSLDAFEFGSTDGDELSDVSVFKLGMKWSQDIKQDLFAIIIDIIYLNLFLFRLALHVKRDISRYIQILRNPEISTVVGTLPTIQAKMKIHLLVQFKV